MFRDMRRKNQLLSQEESINILLKNTSGVLSVLGDNDYPYGVPLSYFYNDNKIYFHCALEGHKIDAIKKNAKVSFCVIDQDKVVEEKFTTCFKSVIAFGKAKIITEEKEFLQSIFALAKKYSPSMPENMISQEIDKFKKNMNMVVIEIEHLTGKEAIELVKQRKM